MKYRKKLVVVEAEQFLPDGEVWPNDVERHTNHDNRAGPCVVCKNSLEEHGRLQNVRRGYSLVCPGDWIITHPHGGKTVCCKGAFRAYYEPVEEEAHA